VRLGAWPAHTPDPATPRQSAATSGSPTPSTGAITTFAERYAACTIRDHKTLLEAIADGRLAVSDVV
jgi:hypothetical protein